VIDAGSCLGKLRAALPGEIQAYPTSMTQPQIQAALPRVIKPMLVSNASPPDVMVKKV